MKYAVVFGRIGDDSETFTYKATASTEPEAIRQALEWAFESFYGDVYDDADSMINDGYDLYDVIPETFFND